MRRFYTDRVLLALILISHFTTALHPIAMLGLNLQIYDFLILLWFMWVLALRRQIRFDGAVMYFIPLLLMGVWAFGLSIASTSPKTISLLLQLVRSVIVGILIVDLSRRIGVDALLRTIALGVKWAISLTLISLAASKIGFFDGAFETGNAGSIRFEGFANDSNFLGMMLLILVAVSYRYLTLLWTIVGITLCILTMSRTVFLALAFFVTVQILSFIARNWRQALSIGFFGLCFFALFVVLVEPGFSFSIKMPEILEIMADRFNRIGNRLVIWTALINDLLASGSIFGNGLRSSQLIVVEVSQNRYSHNTYIDLLYEYGIVSLAYFLSVYMILIVHQLQKDLTLFAVTGLQLLMFMTLSVLYLPFTFMVLAVMLAKRELTSVTRNVPHLS